MLKIILTVFWKSFLIYLRVLLVVIKVYASIILFFVLGFGAIGKIAGSYRPENGRYGSRSCKKRAEARRRCKFF